MRRKHLLLQFSRFLAVGGLATMTHVAVFVLLVEYLVLHPLLANLYAFCVAFAIGFTGHYYWTFARADGPASRARGPAMARFLLVSVAGLGLNSLVVYCVVGLLSLSYLYAALLMVTLVPLLIFLLNRSWAFA